MSLLGMLLGNAAFAQAAQPAVDESKIPEWVKRQARSPYKVIIESNAVRAKPAATKADVSGKQAARKAPAVPGPKPSATPAAAVVADGARASAATPEPAQPPTLEPASTTSPPPVVTRPAAAEPAPPAVAAPEPAKEAIAQPEPVTSAAKAAPTEPLPVLVPLTLVKRVEPALSVDLIDNRLNTARVVVAFTVNTNGEVVNLSVASTTDTRLNRSVVRAVQAWRYAPIPEPREHMVSFAFTSE